MHISGSGTAMQIDLSVVVTSVKTTEEARGLPCGTVVGDTHGGVTFSDAVALELEKRSRVGWCDVFSGQDQNRWTVIILNR
jgi:hypothetical protein